MIYVYLVCVCVRCVCDMNVYGVCDVCIYGVCLCDICVFGVCV